MVYMLTFLNENLTWEFMKFICVNSNFLYETNSLVIFQLTLLWYCLFFLDCLKLCCHLKSFDFIDSQKLQN